MKFEELLQILMRGHEGGFALCYDELDPEEVLCTAVIESDHRVIYWNIE
jgi:hypothetical protein